jgi:hypothetical protein
VIDFIEVQAPVGATVSAHALVDPEWARKVACRADLEVRKGSSVD